MSRKKERVATEDVVDGIAEGANLILAVIISVIVAITISGGIYALVSQLNSAIAFLCAAIAFIPGLIIGFLAYQFRWVLRGLFD